MGNALTENSIRNNGGQGIDLDNNGPVPNDAGDGDTGPNNLQNYPVITSVTVSGGTATIRGTLNSEPGTEYRIEPFRNQSCDGTHGEGRPTSRSPPT